MQSVTQFEIYKELKTVDENVNAGCYLTGMFLIFTPSMYVLNFYEYILFFIIRMFTWPRQKVSALDSEISHLEIKDHWGLGPMKIQNFSLGRPCLSLLTSLGPTGLCFPFYSGLDSGQNILDKRNLILFSAWFENRRQPIFLKRKGTVF